MRRVRRALSQETAGADALVEMLQAEPVPQKA
jgi:hypothetical protein